MSFEIIRTTSTDRDFTGLVKLLDLDLNRRYGEIQKQFNPHNKLDDIIGAVVVYRDGVPAACGAIKEYSAGIIELKRIYVKDEYRRQGLSKMIVNRLEELARGIGYRHAVLETGNRQHEAISLYQKLGYTVTKNYEPYIGNENSVCMKKDL